MVQYRRHSRTLEVEDLIRKLDTEGEIKFGGDGDLGDTILDWLDEYFSATEDRWQQESFNRLGRSEGYAGDYDEALEDYE